MYMYIKKEKNIKYNWIWEYYGILWNYGREEKPNRPLKRLYSFISSCSAINMIWYRMSGRR